MTTMRAIRRFDGKWQVDAPSDLMRWMWKYDGEEAVIIDDATKTYYCATEAAAQAYREKWAAEFKRDDPRTAAMFDDLGRRLWKEGNL